MNKIFKSMSRNKKGKKSNTLLISLILEALMDISLEGSLCSLSLHWEE